jgi:hypothetical protein
MNRTQNSLLAALAGALAFTRAHAQQYPIPTTAADVAGPAPGTAMTKEYFQMVGRIAYFWGWPLVNMADRATTFAKAPERCSHGKIGRNVLL